MTDYQTVHRSIEASQVLDNQAYKDAMQSVKDQVVQQWKDCPVRDVEGQRLLLQLAKISEKFEATLAGMIEAGKFAQHKIDLDAMRDESKARQMLRRVM